MRYTLQSSTPLIALLALWAGSCASPPSPTEANPPSASLSAPGAVSSQSLSARAIQAPRIRGIVVSSSRASGGAGLGVTLVGTALSTTTDTRGQFTINDAPVGPAVLRLVGQGVNLTLAVMDLQAGKEQHIRIRLDGSRAALECAMQVDEPVGNNVTNIQHPEGDGNVCDQGAPSQDPGQGNNSQGPRDVPGQGGAGQPGHGGDNVGGQGS